MTNLAPTRQAVHHATARARLRVMDNVSWLNAVNKAAVELDASPWLFNGTTLKIHSRTQADMWYTVRHGRCTCKAASAGRPCWHKAAYGLIVRALELQ